MPDDASGGGVPPSLRPFAFATAGEILFGRGRATEAPERIGRLGAHVLLVHGRRRQRAAWLIHALEAAGREVTEIAATGEPDIEMLTAALATARRARPDVVIGLGGGAAIDLAKAVAGLAPAPGDPLDHLEVVGKGAPLTAEPLPLVAIPTTAGTGAEVTRNAVIGMPDHRRKVSLRDRRLLPAVAIIDPALTDGTPPAVTLASGLDALTQVIEPWISSRANALTDALVAPAIPAGIGALTRLMRGEDAGARDTLAWVSLCGGLALANAGLGAVHGFAGVLGGRTGAAHGAICGRLLPFVLAMNERIMRDDPARGRIREIRSTIAAALAVDPDAALPALADWSRRHGLPSLRDMGHHAVDDAALAQAALAASSMKANPVMPGLADLMDVLAAERAAG
ncbi:MAG: iron-containing alcohol dehydrogenase [Pseudomonadota bacterium]